MTDQGPTQKLATQSFLSKSTSGATDAPAVSKIEYFSGSNSDSLLGTPAPFFPRAAAFLIDCVLANALAAGLFLLLGMFLFGHYLDQQTAINPSIYNNRLIQLELILFGLPFLTYSTIQIAARGRTVGKAMLGLQIVPVGDRANGVNPNGGLGAGRAFRRTCGYFLSALIAGMGFWCIFYRENRRTWHDQLSDTSVVRVPKIRGMTGLLALQILVSIVGWWILLAGGMPELQRRLERQFGEPSSLGSLAMFDSPLVTTGAAIWYFCAQLSLPLLIIWPSLCLWRATALNRQNDVRFGGAEKQAQSSLAFSFLGFATLLVVVAEHLKPTLSWLLGAKYRQSMATSWVVISLFAAIPFLLVVISPLAAQMKRRDAFTWVVTSGFLLALALSETPAPNVYNPYGNFEFPISWLGMFYPLAPLAVALPTLMLAWAVYRCGNVTRTWIVASILFLAAIAKIFVLFGA